MSLIASKNGAALVAIPNDPDHTNLKQASGAPTDPPRLKVSFSPDGESAPIQKTFLVNHGQEGMLETLLRRAFSIPANFGVSLVLDRDSIYYPVHVIDLTEARKAKSIELQTFPIQPVPVHQLPLPLPIPITANQITPQLIPNVEYMNPPYANQSNTVARQINEKPSSEPVGLDYNKQQSASSTSKRKSAKNVKKNVVDAFDSNVSSNNINGGISSNVNTTTTTSTHHIISIENDNDNEQQQNTTSNNNKEDRRKNNRGLDHRRSYLKEEKILVMWLKDCGKSADDIAAMTHVSKSNVEKWCSDKTREKILLKFRSSNKNSSSGGDADVNDVLGDTLDESGLHFARDNRVSMQSSLLFLLDRLKTLSSESNMVIDETALFTAAGLSVPASHSGKNNETNNSTINNNVENNSANSDTVSLGSKRLFNLDDLYSTGNNSGLNKNSNQAVMDFLLQNKRARLSGPAAFPSVPYPYMGMYPANAHQMSNLATITRGFVPPQFLQATTTNNSNFMNISNMSDDEDEEDEASAHMMLEEMLRSRRQSLGLTASVKANSSSANKSSSTFSNIAVKSNNNIENAEPGLPHKRVKSSLDLLSDLAEAESASVVTISDSTVKPILTSNLPIIPTNLPRYEDVRMEYNDQFACTFPTELSSNGQVEEKSTEKNVETNDNDAETVETSDNISAVSGTSVPVMAVSTSGSVQALRSVLPNTKYLLQIRPQLREKQSDQDKEDEEVMTMLGE